VLYEEKDAAAGSVSRGLPMKIAALWLAFALTRAAAVLLLSEYSDSEIYANYAEKLRSRGTAGFYRTETVEYPALAVAYMVPPAFVADRLPDRVERIFKHRRTWTTGTAADRYQVAFQLLLLPLDALLLLGLSRLARRIYPGESAARHCARLWIYVLATGAMGCIVYDRLDLIVGGFAVLAVAAFAAGRPAWMHPALAAGVLFKIVPLLLVPAAVLFAAATAARFWPALVKQSLYAAAWLVAGPLLLFALYGDGPFKLLKYHSERGVQVHASYGFLLKVLQPETDVILNFGSHNYRGPLADGVARANTPIVFGCLGISFACAAAGVRRYGATPPRLVLAFASAWLAYILGNKVGSPQYILWVIPLAALSPLDTPRGRWWAAGFVALCGWTGMGYPWLYWHIVGLEISDEPAWDGPNVIGLCQLAVQGTLLLGVTLIAWERLAKDTITPCPPAGSAPVPAA
jgi:hypothetical protein